MRSYKPYLVAAFFAALTALRLLFPQQAALAQHWLHQAVDPLGDCRAMAQTLGRALDGYGVREGLIEVIRLAGEVLA